MLGGIRVDMANCKSAIWLIVCVTASTLLAVNGKKNVSIEILKEAVFSGAVCLDGTPPAFYFIRGFGDGASSWVVFLSGGGWCVSDNDCLNRSRTALGSSDFMPREFGDTNGIFSSSPLINPYFYDWNKVKVEYCDGASFSADIPHVNPATNLSYRGARIFTYVVEELKSRGMNHADNAMLAGESAGGLATMLKCDQFRSLLPDTPTVKCLSDAGYFFRGNTTVLPSTLEPYFANLVMHHQLAGLLPRSCTSKMNNPELCIYPQYFIGDIQTPLFLVHSQFDYVQMVYQMATNDTDWTPCLEGRKLCKFRLVKFIKEFRQEFVAALPKRDGSLSRGLYVDSCSIHGQCAYTSYWNVMSNLKDTTISKAVGDWFYEISPFQEIEDIDQPYNCTA